MPFWALSAVRVESLISLKVGSINISKQIIKQRIKEDVSTKFSKNIDSFYFSLPSKEFKQVFENWYNYITLDLGYKQNYPLFPKVQITLSDDLSSTQQGFGKKLKHFTSTTAEQMKAWSQNLGHSSINTTFSSYGTVSINRVKEVLGGLEGGKQN